MHEPRPITVAINGRDLLKVIDFARQHGQDAYAALALGLLNLLDTSTAITANHASNAKFGFVQIIGDRWGVNSPMTGFNWASHVLDTDPLQITWPQGRRHLIYNGGLVHHGPTDPGDGRAPSLTVDLSRLTTGEALRHSWGIHT